MKKVLVVAIHPDDETLGCGGTLLKHKAMGDKLFWLIATDAVKEFGADSPLIRQTNKEIGNVSKLYGFDGVHELHLPVKQVDQVPMAELVEKITKVIQEIKPDTIYLPFHGDVHSDHRYFFQAAFSCVKTFRYPFIKKVLMMETISETEFAPALIENAFIPNYFVDITKYINLKLKIMSIYKDEIQKQPLPRSKENIKALATFRGSMANCKFAESFMLLKEIL